MSRQAPRFELPRRKKWSIWAILLSAAINALILIPRVAPWLPPSRLPPTLIVLVPPGSEGERAAELQFQEPGGAAKKGRAAGVTPQEEPQPAPTPEPEKPAQIVPDTIAALPREPAESVAAPTPVPGRPYVRIGPAMGEGKLWVRPLPVSPRELAQTLTRSHIELVDSAVSAIVTAYIDSVLSAPAQPGARLPSWTTQILGKTFGIDSKYIYLGGLKIPSAVLALLPIKGGGQTMEFSQANRMALIREDLVTAAQRAQTMEDFKRAVRELRAERERLRELAKNQRLNPDSTEKKP